MADTKISALSAAAALDGTELVPIVQGGSNAQTTTADIADVLKTDLAADTGAGLIGTTSGDTVQDELDSINAVVDNIGTVDFSASPAASKVPIEIEYTFAGEAADDSDYRGLLLTCNFAGSEGGAQMNNLHLQCEVVNDGSTDALTLAQACEAYVRAGFDGTIDANVSAAIVFSGHVANEAPTAAIAQAMVFKAKDTDFNDGGSPASSGSIAFNYGFYSGNLSHATKLTSAAYGFFAANMTTPGTGVIAAAFASDMSSGTGKRGLYLTGNVVNALRGPLRIGDTGTAPTDFLEIKGFAKLSGDGTVGTAGTFHELRSPTSGQFAAQVANSHATAPNCLDLFFAGGAPNNGTQQFLRARDTSATRLQIFGNGNVVNVNNSYGAISDKRLKTGIRDATPQLADIKALRFRKYKMKAGGEAEQIGLVAQEVEKVSPGLVFEDADGMKGVNYSVLYVKAVKALQELALVVEEQGRELAALKSARV